jgi:hypothetical protein
MDYQQMPQPGNGKKIVIIASVAVVAVAALVLVVLLIRNASLQPEPEVPGPGTGTGETPGDGTLPPPPDGGPGPGTEVPATIVEDPQGPLPPEGPSGEDLSAPLQAGISRPLTAEEKAKYGFDTAAVIWMTTSRPTDGSRPEASFEDRSPSAALPPDADVDGLSDAEEATRGTDSRNPDTDGDEMFDGDEVRTYGTDPLKADTDGDGVGDHDEAEGGTDPLKP